MQISFIMEENNMLNQQYQDAEKELDVVRVQMKEQINEQKMRNYDMNSGLEFWFVRVGVRVDLPLIEMSI